MPRNPIRDLRRLRLSSGFRRFLSNTVFDSTFMLLGVVIGSAFSEDADLRVILTTMLVSSLSLGISTGVSVYEAETLEQDKRISELEQALFRNCLLYTSPSPRDRTRSRMPSSA